MIKATLKLMPFFLFTIITFNSCKKNSDQKSKTELLTQKDWVMSKYELKSGGSVWIDETQYWQDFSKDDHFVFRTNNTVEQNEGATKCDASDPQIVDTGSWAFSDNETKITWFGKTSTIDQLNETTLIITTTDNSGETTISERITFVH